MKSPGTHCAPFIHSFIVDEWETTNLNRDPVVSSLGGVPSGSGSFNADDELSGESYDSDGNVTASGGKTFGYDSQNQLTSMGGAVTIIYDGDGNRVSKTVGGVTTQYLVDDLNPTSYAQAVEELVGGAVTRQYTYGLQRISQNQPISNVWTASFYGYDGGGNVRTLTNSAGAITDDYEYDAFGNSFTKLGTTPNVYLYRAEQYDPDLGLYYLRARYYNPATGRFMSRDPENGRPLNPGSLHKYLYADGDPVNGLDRSGWADEEEQGGIISWITKRAPPALAALTEGAAQAAATIQYYAGLAYLTLNDFLAALAANEYVGAITKTLGCITVGVMLNRMLNEVNLTEDDKYAALFAYKSVCTLVIVAPWNGPDPEGPWGGDGYDF